MTFTALMSKNLVLSLSIFSWATAQILKGIVVVLQEHRFDIHRFLDSGGMPSSHSSFVCTCATTVGKLYGFSGPMFAVSTVVAVIVMYDAFNVRRAAGEQAKRLNYIMNNWADMSPAHFGQELKELLGHTPLQVIAGALLGIFIGWFGVDLLAI